MKRHLRACAVLWGLTSAVLPACSPHHDLYRAQLRQSVSALQAAQGAQAAASSTLAALHLALAQEQLRAAERLHALGHTHRAVDVLRRAEADAQLALALVQKSSAQAQAEEMADRATDFEAHKAQSKHAQKPNEAPLPHAPPAMGHPSAPK